MPTCLIRALFSFLILAQQPSSPGEPTAKSLIDRHAKENAPVWVDGNTATFFYRGDAEQVQLFIGGEQIALRRLPESDVWTATVTKPDMAKGIFTYAIVPGKKEESIQGKRLHFERWRGPQAPPPVARVKQTQGEVRTIDFDSKALGEKRKLRVYLPPGHDRAKTYPVIYATDGNDAGQLLEPLITEGKISLVISVATSSGNYLGDRKAAYDTKKDLRALEYLAGFDPTRYAVHEKFFCDEVRTWAEQEFGAAKDRKQRAIFGCSNGARFAVDMGIRHPELYGHVIAFSVAGNREMPLPEKTDALPHYYLAAGSWEGPFLKITTNVAERLKKHGVPVTFVPRVAGHDMTMWEEELVAAVKRAFGASSFSQPD